MIFANKGFFCCSAADENLQKPKMLANLLENLHASLFYLKEHEHNKNNKHFAGCILTLIINLNVTKLPKKNMTTCKMPLYKPIANMFLNVWL